MWPSETWAGRLFDIANWGLIVGLVVGVISTVFLVWMGNVKETYLRRELGATGERAAEAQKTAEGFRRDIALSNERSAEANQRAASLEVEALKLRGQLLVQGPRENLLRGEKRQEFVDVLKPFTGQKIDVRRSASVIEVNGEVVMSTPIGDDTIGLSRSFISALRDAGWHSPPDPLLSAFHGEGLKVEIAENASAKTVEAAKALVEALRGLPLSVEGPLLDNEEQAKRVGKEVISPAFGKDTIILLVMTHP